MESSQKHCINDFVKQLEPSIKLLIGKHVEKELKQFAEAIKKEGKHDHTRQG